MAAGPRAMQPGGAGKICRVAAWSVRALASQATEVAVKIETHRSGPAVAGRQALQACPSGGPAVSSAPSIRPDASVSLSLASQRTQPSATNQQADSPFEALLDATQPASPAPTP